MKHQKIKDQARVWMLTRGPDGKLQEQIDPNYVGALAIADTAEEIADVLVIEAGKIEIAETRLW